jgi:hypothetical protein
VRLGVLLLLVATSLTPAAPSQAADPAPVVTWPAQATFNPDTTPYTFSVQDTGSGALWARWNGDFRGGPAEPVSSNGDHTMTFPFDGAGVIEILRCSTDGSACEVVATSPRLTVFAHLHPFVYEPVAPVTGTGPIAIRMTAEPAVTGEPVTLTWSLVSTTTHDVAATGTAQGLVEDAHGTAHLQLDRPEGLPDGPYQLLATASATTEDFGSLSGDAPFALVIDNHPLSAEVSVSRRWFAPKPDGFRDCVRIHVSASEPAHAQVIVLNRDGHAVAVPWDGPMRLDRRVRWCGENMDGHRVPAGRYRIRAWLNDYAQGGAGPRTSVEVRRG